MVKTKKTWKIYPIMAQPLIFGKEPDQLRIERLCDLDLDLCGIQYANILVVYPKRISAIVDVSFTYSWSLFNPQSTVT